MESNRRTSVHLKDYYLTLVRSLLQTLPRIELHRYMVISYDLHVSLLVGGKGLDLVVRKAPTN